MIRPISQQIIKVKLYIPDPAVYCPANGYYEESTISPPDPAVYCPANGYETPEDLIEDGYYTADSFVFEVLTTTTNETVTLPISGDVNFMVGWGDGTSNTITNASSSDKIHTYTDAGLYTVIINGFIYGMSTVFGGSESFRVQIQRIIQWGEIGFYELCFTNCTGLKTIPNSAMTGVTNLVSCEILFYGCTNLQQSIPYNLFDNCVNVTSFQGTFSYSAVKGAIPAGLFDNCPDVTNFVNTFDSCTGLTSIPTGLFTNNTLVTSFFSTFGSCSSITSVIPTNLFVNCTEVTTFAYTFYNTKITGAIPTGLFVNCTKVETFTNTFYGTDITSIPTGLFTNNTLVTSFQSTFDGTDITSIPTGLFNTNTLVTNFHRTFAYTKITSIPTGLFNNCPDVVYFSQIFMGVTTLTSIPSGLFNNNTAVQYFDSAFSFCTGLTSIPTGLFRLNVNVVSFNNVFSQRTKTALNQYIFYNAGEQSTRFAGKTVDFRFAFASSYTYTGAQGTAPDLWTCTFGSVQSTDCYDGIGNSTASLSNYASIPTAWK